MAGFSLKPIGRQNSRSISLPTRSHPVTLKFEEQLNNLRSLEASSGISIATAGLSGLAELYKCIEDLLNLPLTLQAFSQHQGEKWVEELLEESVTYLDICSSTRDIVLVLKTSVCEIESALRRRRASEDISIQSDARAYSCSLKKVKKGTLKSLVCLKQIDSKFSTSPPLDLDEHLTAVVRVLREASLMSNSVMRSLLLYLNVPVLQPRSSRWFLMSKFVFKRMQGSDVAGDISSELGEVGAALENLMVNNRLSRDGVGELIHSTCQKLRALEGSVQGLEKELEFLFKHMINTRVSLLNKLSH